MTYKKARLFPIVMSTLFVAIFSIEHLAAQQLVFQKENYKDSITLARAIPSLAERVILLHRNSDRTAFYDEMYRYFMLAHQYDRALDYIDSFRRSLPPNQLGNSAQGLQYETLIRARMAQQKDNTPLEEAFKHIFTQTYPRLDPDARNYISGIVRPKLGDLKRTLDNLIARQKTDSISLNDAEHLLRSYNSYISYSIIAPLAKPIADADDLKTFVITRELIKTRDGSLLQAETGRRRDSKEKLPTVFIFNIYIDSSSDLAKVRSYALKGYACVVANTRGKGNSPQSIDPFEHDATDAYDIIDWISRQPWSNKKVGMTGGSYLGFAQWAAAKMVHPALKTIMPEVSVGSGIDFPMTGNVFKSYMLPWLHDVTNGKQTDDADSDNDDHWDSVGATWYQRGASFRSLDSLEGRPNRIFQRWLQHPSNDSYWKDTRADGGDFSKINIPVLTTTGYYDADDIGAMYYFREHYRNNPNANNYLVIGPYDHGGAQSAPRDVIFGYKIDSIAATVNFVDLGVKWFDYVLKDSAKPALLQDKVNYEVMGANEWRHAPSLAAMSNDTLTLYLSNTRVDQYYKLNETPKADEYISQEIDFADRSDAFTETHPLKLPDNTISNKNSISFVSRPVDRPMIVNASFLASLNAAINKKDMDLSLVMYEETPEGKFFMLSSTIQRASYARDRSRRQLLEPGKKETIPVNYSFMTCKKLSKGSRLVFLLSIYKGRDYQINYGTGKDVSDETIADAKEPLEIKWFADSYFKVPVWK